VKGRLADEIRGLVLLLSGKPFELLLKPPLPVLLQLFKHLQPFGGLFVDVVLLRPLPSLLFIIGLDYISSVNDAASVKMLVADCSLVILFAHSREGSALLIEMIHIHAPCDYVAVAGAMSVVVRGVRLSPQLMHVRGLLSNGTPLNLVQHIFCLGPSVSDSSLVRFFSTF
jgi:hypothetical protein